MRFPVFAWSLLLAIVGLSQAALAQGEGVKLTDLPSSIRVGERVRATLKIMTRRRASEPVLPKVDGLRLALGTPGRNQVISIVNGRRTAEISLNYPVEVRATRVGKVRARADSRQDRRSGLRDASTGDRSGQGSDR